MRKWIKEVRLWLVSLLSLALGLGAGYAGVTDVEITFKVIGFVGVFLGWLREDLLEKEES